jgi:hypothetical protein
VVRLTGGALAFFRLFVEYGNDLPPHDDGTALPGVLNGATEAAACPAAWAAATWQDQEATVREPRIV